MGVKDNENDDVYQSQMNRMEATQINTYWLLPNFFVDKVCNMKIIYYLIQLQPLFLCLIYVCFFHGLEFSFCGVYRAKQVPAW